MKKSRSLWRYLLLVFAGTVFAFGVMILIAASVIYPQLPDVEELKHYHPKLPLQIYSSDGVLLGQFGQERRIFLSFKQTPTLLISAILSAEDARFYEHTGVDIWGILRACISNVLSLHIKSGASTITMQVARNFFLNSDRKYLRKLYEVLLAYKIEQFLSKQQILELYINQIYLGQRAYGFSEAALVYFGKPIGKLTLLEYAVLAGLPKAPSAYNPVVNQSRSRDRAVYVLHQMLANGYITRQEYINATLQDIDIVKGSLLDYNNSGAYISETVRKMLYKKYGDAIYDLGYRVYTTIDSKMQLAAYTALRNGLVDYDISRGYRGAEVYTHGTELEDVPDYGDLRAALVLQAQLGYLQLRIKNGNIIELRDHDVDIANKFINSGAHNQITQGSIIRIRKLNQKWTISQLPDVEGTIVAINPNNGAIKAMVGGFDFAHNGFNHAMQAMRQPGSTFKPFIYSAALENNINPSTVIDDAEICFDDNLSPSGKWCPRNDDNLFLGPITVRQGLNKSRNITTIKILDQITPQRAIDHIVKFGFNRDQLQPYLTLGLGVNEVTPLQLSVGFAVFANGGYLVEPYIIDKIFTANGKLVATTTPVSNDSKSPVIDPRNSYIMHTMLLDTVRYGTANRAYQILKRNDIAGKTGTTTDARDVWFSGYNSSLVATCWVGYDNPKSLGMKQYGANLALPIWINFMQRILPSLPIEYQKVPDGVNVIKGGAWHGGDEYEYGKESN